MKQNTIANKVERAILDAGCLVEGDFTFASGQRAKLKLDMEILARTPKALQVVVGILSSHPALKAADVLLAVPEGAQKLFGDRVAIALDIPLARLKRVGPGRYDFTFVSPADRKLALAAKHPRIIEDVVTTLGSVAAVARLLNANADIQSLAVWRRGKVDPKYQGLIKDHYLIEKPIPLF